MTESESEITFRDVFRSGVFNVAASACASIVVPALDRRLGETVRWYVLLLLSLAPGTPSLLYPIVKPDISLHAYVILWHLELFLHPMWDRFIRMGTDDDFLGRMAMIEWQLRAYLFRSAAGLVFSWIWAARCATATLCALLAGTWVLFPHFSHLTRGRVCLQLLHGYLAVYKYIFTRDLSVRTALLRLHQQITIPLDRWERDVARRKRSAEQASKRPVPFVYRPLESPRHIRLLQLKRRTWFSAPSCELIHVCLDDLGEDHAPAYEAVSYTWGPKPPSIPLDVGGQQLLVTSAVENLLFRRRSSFGPIHLWIDAVCINQSSTAEKDAQLPLMREIYRAAARTLIWLDADEPSGAGEAAAVRRLIRAVGFNTWLLGERHMKEALDIFKEDELAYRAVARLLAHPWFCRIWILQEVAVSSEINVLLACGSCLDWFTLERFIDYVRDSSHLARTFQHYESPRASVYEDPSVGLEVATNAEPAGLSRTTANVWFMSQVRHGVLTGQPPPLGALTAGASFFASSEPRDMVFALLGVAADGDALPFKPEYGRPVGDIFVDVARYLISSAQGKWSIQLTMAGRGYLTTLTGTPSAHAALLPSWVPDFASPNFLGARAPQQRLLSRIDPSGAVTVLNHGTSPALLLSASPVSAVVRLTTAPFPVRNHRTLRLNPGAIDLDSQIFRFLSNANRPAREWYASAVDLVLAQSSQSQEEDEAGRQRLWHLLVKDHNLADGESAASPDGEATAQPLLYPIRSAQARRLFDLYTLSPLESWLGLSGPAATGDANVSTKMLAEYMEYLVQAVLSGAAGRKVAVLSDGRLALVPPDTWAQDQVVVVKGGWSPVVFRAAPANRAGPDQGKAGGRKVGELVGSCTLGGDEDKTMRDGGDGGWEEWILV